MTIDVDGLEVKDGIVLIGDASQMPDGTWRSLANVRGTLAVVQLNVSIPPDTFDAPLV